MDLFGDKMKKSIKLFAIAILIFISLSTAAVSAVYEVYPGEIVDLRGSCTSDYVYLFVTGPNLPSNGGNPENIYEGVVSGDPSSFVRVSVFNNRWSYKWDTRTADGVPDTGTYTFYAVEKPQGRSDLSGERYSVQTIRLLDPYVSVSGTSSSENSGYYISSETQEKTATPTATATKKVTARPTTVKATKLITATPTATPAAGIPPVILILSLFMSIFLVVYRKRGPGETE